MRTSSCCHTIPAFILKSLNFLQTFVGVSIIVYSVYMLNQWNHHSAIPPSLAPSPDYPDAIFSNFDTVRVPDHTTHLNLAVDVVSGLNDGLNLHLHGLPAPWFIYAFMGVGIVVCCITCIGQIAAESINGCCLCFFQYSVLTAVLMLLEAVLVAFIAIDRQWEKDLPFDPSGELDSLRAFIKDNVDVCEWVGITVLIIQALSLLFAIILRAMVSTHREDHDVEGDYDVERSRAWDPLLNPQFSPASGSLKADAKGAHSDIWSSRIRDKYGLHGGDVKSLLNQNAPVSNP